jgi:hypothetical protein
LHVPTVRERAQKCIEFMIWPQAGMKVTNLSANYDAAVQAQQFDDAVGHSGAARRKPIRQIFGGCCA